MTIPAGSTSGTFAVSTSVVAAQTAVTITGNYGVNRTATLTVNPSVAIARFTVSGASGVDNCKLTNNGNSFDCGFDGSASSGPGTIIAWDWNYAVVNAKSETTNVPTLQPNPNCNLILPLPANKPAFLNLIVSLKVHDSLNNVSATTTNNNVKILPTGQACGF